MGCSLLGCEFIARRDVRHATRRLNGAGSAPVQNQEPIMLIRTLLVAAALCGATVMASAQTGVTGEFRNYSAAQSHALRGPAVASTGNAGVVTPPVMSASVMCPSGAHRGFYVVSVENGICGGVQGRHAQCISQATPPGLAMATCQNGCRSTTGTGRCTKR
jgi:hypothetical protein